MCVLPATDLTDWAVWAARADLVDCTKTRSVHARHGVETLAVAEKHIVLYTRMKPANRAIGHCKRTAFASGIRYCRILIRATSIWIERGMWN